MDWMRNAAKLAHEWHRGQTRKYTGRPYVEHPMRVATRVMLAGGDEDMVAAAWLHDVLEDTKCPASAIVRATSLKVLTLVEELTNPSKGSLAPRAERKRMDREHLSRVSSEAKVIKLADRLDNLLELAGASVEFIELYCAESRSLVKVIGDVRPVLRDEIVAACLTLELAAEAKAA